MLFLPIFANCYRYARVVLTDISVLLCVAAAGGRSKEMVFYYCCDFADGWLGFYRSWEFEHSHTDSSIREDLLANRVIWYKTWQQDLWFFQWNNHSVLSVFRSHPLHPYSKIKRLIVLLALLGLSFFLAAISQGQKHSCQRMLPYRHVTLCVFRCMHSDFLFRVMCLCVSRLYQSRSNTG